MERKETQENMILKHLDTGVGITPIQALTFFGCFRLAAVIHKLKKKGHKITTKIVEKDGKSYAKYHLVGWTNGGV